jgi:hypothetical protein
MTKRKRTFRQTLTPAQIAQQHLWCPVEAIKKGPHTGLYCATHGTWLKWISLADQAKIADIVPIR